MTERTKTAEERIVEPARRWRNWWLATFTGEYADGTFVRIGDVTPGPRVWPSRDSAETAAARTVEKNLSCDEQPVYLGAFPEGQRPGE